MRPGIAFVVGDHGEWNYLGSIDGTPLSKEIPLHAPVDRIQWISRDLGNEAVIGCYHGITRLAADGRAIKYTPYSEDSLTGRRLSAGDGAWWVIDELHARLVDSLQDDGQLLAHYEFSKHSRQVMVDASADSTGKLAVVLGSEADSRPMLLVVIGVDGSVVACADLPLSLHAALLSYSDDTVVVGASEQLWAYSVTQGSQGWKPMQTPPEIGTWQPLLLRDGLVLADERRGAVYYAEWNK